MPLDYLSYSTEAGRESVQNLDAGNVWRGTSTQRRNWLLPVREPRHDIHVGRQSIPRRPLVRLLESAYQFLVIRIPNKRGSVTNTFVVSAVSSEFKNAPVIAVVSTTFLVYAIACQPSWLVNIRAKFRFV